jgi:hypothetical protein
MPSDTASVPSVTDSERLREAAAGPNWTCEFCGSHQRALNGGCQECGAGKPEPAAHVEPPEVHHEPPEIFNEPEDVAPSRISIKKILTYAGAGIGGAAAIGSFIWLMVFLFGTHEVEAQVSAIRWQHTVTLEQRYTLSGSGWDSDMPGGSFNVSCQTKQRGTENCNPYQCNPHQVEYQCNPHNCNSRQEGYDCNPHDCNCHEVCTDNGNGYASCDDECDTCYETCTREVHDTCYETCERTEYDTCYHQCPVYDRWCTYNYYEWRTEQTERTSGSTHNENWPALTASGDT